MEKKLSLFCQRFSNKIHIRFTCYFIQETQSWAWQCEMLCIMKPSRPDEASGGVVVKAHGSSDTQDGAFENAAAKFIINMKTLSKAA